MDLQELKEDEAQRILSVYRGYAAAEVNQAKRSPQQRGNLAIHKERSRVMAQLLHRARLMPLAGKRILEVGCGAGGVLKELVGLGAEPSQMAGIDLVPERIESARRQLPAADLRLADARAIPFAGECFDVVVVFTVFSSILDGRIAEGVAGEIRRVLKPGGAIVWYDFQYNNPRNPNVRGVRRSQVQAWFPSFRGLWETLTLLPPLARGLGVMTGLAYPILSGITILRTHQMGVLLNDMG